MLQAFWSFIVAVMGDVFVMRRYHLTLLHETIQTYATLIYTNHHGIILFRQVIVEFSALKGHLYILSGDMLLGENSCILPTIHNKSHRWLLYKLHLMGYFVQNGSRGGKGRGHRQRTQFLVRSYIWRCYLFFTRLTLYSRAALVVYKMISIRANWADNCVIYVDMNVLVV